MTIQMATLPVYMLVTRSSWADVNFLLLDDVSLGSTDNSFTILFVSSSVLLVGMESRGVTADVEEEHVAEGVMDAVTVS